MDSLTNVATATVQVFPILGILGTVLAIGESLQGIHNEEVISGIIAAFTRAIDTTIYGLIAASFYMIVDAIFQARYSRLRDSIESYREVLKYANRTNGLDSG